MYYTAPAHADSADKSVELQFERNSGGRGRRTRAPSIGEGIGRKSLELPSHAAWSGVVARRALAAWARGRNRLWWVVVTGQWQGQNRRQELGAVRTGQTRTYPLHDRRELEMMLSFVSPVARAPDHSGRGRV